MKKACKLLLLVIVLSLSLVGCATKKEKVEVDAETTKEVSKEEPVEKVEEELAQDDEKQKESTEENKNVEEKSSKDKETMTELTTNVENKADLGEIKTPFTAKDIKIYAGFKEKTSEGYIVNGKVTNNSKTPMKSILATIEFNEGEDIGYVDVYDTVMPNRSRTSETLSSVEIKKIDAISAQVTWLNDNGEEMFTEVDFQLGTTLTN